MTHYEVLGVPQTATAEEIKAAYRKLAKDKHPDLHPDLPGSKEAFQQLQAAHAVLSDPAQRETYDLTLDLEPARQASARVMDHAMKEAESLGVELVRSLARAARRRLKIG